MNDNNYKRIYDPKWNFKEGSMQEIVHGIHPYPAMMMPRIARTMLEKYGNGRETIFLDPFVGSGTTLVEAQLYGVKKAIGIDLNPLAILISKVKTTKYDNEKLRYYLNKFIEMHEQNELADNNGPVFSIRNSWFSEMTIKNLTKIWNFLNTIQEDAYLDFFKVAFSEVVRSSSETRNGEFKLYRMSKSALEKFNPDVISMFINVCERNINIFLKNNYEHATEIELFEEKTQDLVHHTNLLGNVDLIITSPPYGDSHTTVAYGQFSRLANEWLGIKDAGALDRKLLGGKKTDNFIFNIKELDDAIEQIKINDKAFNRERAWEVVSFYKDYSNAVDAIAPLVKKGGTVVFVVGNRRVRNIELPLDVITYKMFEAYGFKHEVTIVRDILNKRMPSKASPSNYKGGQLSTMMHEFIVVMTKKQ